MYAALPVSYLLTVALAVPTGLLMVRIFIVQHDCGHGSFVPSRRANRLIGRLCSLVTLTPFANWSRQHGLHHADWNNLDRRAGGSDMYSACLTVREYVACTPWQRLLYRLPRHPLIANLLLPPLVFALLYRVPFDTPRGWARERRSVHLTNAALAVLFGALARISHRCERRAWAGDASRVGRDDWSVVFRGSWLRGQLKTASGTMPRPPGGGAVSR